MIALTNILPLGVILLTKYYALLPCKIGLVFQSEPYGMYIMYLIIFYIVSMMVCWSNHTKTWAEIPLRSPCALLLFNFNTSCLRINLSHFSIFCHIVYLVAAKFLYISITRQPNDLTSNGSMKFALTLTVSYWVIYNTCTCTPTLREKKIT